MPKPSRKPKTRTAGSSKVKAAKTKRPAPARRSKAAPPAPLAQIAPTALAGAGGPMPPGGDDEFLDSNVLSHGQNATSAYERHVALDHVVTNVWATEDITMIRRVESTGSYKWVMWRRGSLPPG